MAPKPSTGLDVLADFINTRDVEGGIEDLDSPSALRDWLARRGMLDQPWSATTEDFRLALEIRETLRALAAANNEGRTDPDATDTLNRLAHDLPVSLRMDADGAAHLEPRSTGVPGALARLLAIVFTAAVDGSWARFKACRNDECRWVFYDGSKNESRRWCATAPCGNLMNARAYRSRRRQGPSSGSPSGHDAPG